MYLRLLFVKFSFYLFTIIICEFLLFLRLLFVNFYSFMIYTRCTCFVSTVYTNFCGTVSVAEPAIHGKRVLFTFIPKDQTNVSEGGVKWIYYDDHEYEATESTRYNMLVHTTSFTLDLGCSKHEDRRREYSAEYSFSTGG